MNFSMTDYLQNRNYGLIPGAAERGNAAVTNAGVVGQGKLFEAIAAAEMLEKTAGFAGDATRYAGSQMGTASAFGGAMEGIGNLAFGAYKGGHLGGGGGSPGIGTGADFGEVGTSGSDLADFSYTPAEDIAFNNGTGVYWSTN